MSFTYCMTSNCPLASTCLRYETDAAKNSLHRTYADFSEELIRRSEGETSCPFFKDKPKDE